MRSLPWIAAALVLIAFGSTPAAAEQPEVLLGISTDFEKEQITLEVASSGCTKKADFRFEIKESVLTVIRKERDACKAMPHKISLTFAFREMGIDLRTPFRLSNSFNASRRILMF